MRATGHCVVVGDDCAAPDERDAHAFLLEARVRTGAASALRELARLDEHLKVLVRVLVLLHAHLLRDLKELRRRQ